MVIRQEYLLFNKFSSNSFPPGDCISRYFSNLHLVITLYRFKSARRQPIIFQPIQQIVDMNGRAHCINKLAMAEVGDARVQLITQVRAYCMFVLITPTDYSESDYICYFFFFLGGGKYFMLQTVTEGRDTNESTRKTFLLFGPYAYFCWSEHLGDRVPGLAFTKASGRIDDIKTSRMTESTGLLDR